MLSPLLPNTTSNNQRQRASCARLPKRTQNDLHDLVDRVGARTDPDEDDNVGGNEQEARYHGARHENELDQDAEELVQPLRHCGGEWGGKANDVCEKNKVEKMCVFFFFRKPGLVQASAGSLRLDWHWICAHLVCFLFLFL